MFHYEPAKLFSNTEVELRKNALNLIMQKLECEKTDFEYLFAVTCEDYEGLTDANGTFYCDPLQLWVGVFYKVDLRKKESSRIRSRKKKKSDPTFKLINAEKPMWRIPITSVTSLSELKQRRMSLTLYGSGTDSYSYISGNITRGYARGYRVNTG
jgi:hypothetical protein